MFNDAINDDPEDGVFKPWTLPRAHDLRFEGFSEESFAILDRLKAEPHIEQYRQEKTGIKAHLTEPFKRFRDDLVVNWVLPNQLDLETERNVFSRLLKNDFGAGGCHHHLWMAVYRPHLRRLTDVQLSHSISPDGFTTGLYVGDYAKEPLRLARQRIVEQASAFLSVVNPLLATGTWRFVFYTGTGKKKARHAFDEPMVALPDDVGQATALWLRTAFERSDVIAWGPTLVVQALHATVDLQPFYQLII